MLIEKGRAPVDRSELPGIEADALKELVSQTIGKHMIHCGQFVLKISRLHTMPEQMHHQLITPDGDRGRDGYRPDRRAGGIGVAL
jgi:hypothetical protein